MLKSDFFYNLPEELIAQTPLKQRDTSRLLHLDKNSGEIKHEVFHDILNSLNSGDCLVINDTKVLPARIFGKRGENNTEVEFVLLKNPEGNIWETLCRPGKKVKPGYEFKFSDKLSCTVKSVTEEGNRFIEFIYDGNFYEILDEVGKMPLPPYITEKLEDQNRYQTVYANELGSAAAPTAGLHFTNQLLDELKEKGVKIAKVTLHVGLGTFRPVKVENILEHKMHSEYYEVDEEAANTINTAKQNGHKVVCVGTTSCRTVESVSDENGFITPKKDNTEIFIYPGYKFKCMDGLITNFHLPESTLIMLVSAFVGYDNTMNAYKVAVEEKYRFFSFGDAMLII